MRRRWKVLLVTSIAVFMSFLDVSIVNIAFPAMRASFPDASLADLSWVISGYNVVFAAALVPAGRLADRVGRRKLFQIGVIVFVTASVACGLAGSAGFLIGARVLQAVGGAVLVPTSLGLALPEFPAGQRATATALWTATGAVAAATGPVLGGVLVAWQSWRWVFFVNLAIGLASLVPARRLLRESHEPDAPYPDGLGGGLLTVGVAALALGVLKGPDWGWSSAPVSGSLAASALLLTLFLVRSARHPAPVLELSLFRVRSFAVANAGLLVFSVGFYALLLANVLFLTGVWGYSELRAGLALTPGPVMAALGAAVGGRLSDRYGQRVVAVPGAALSAAGALAYAWILGPTPDFVGGFLPAALLGGTGVGLSFAALGSAVVAELPPGRYATGAAVQSTFRQLGAVLGVSALVAVVGGPALPDLLDSFHAAWTFVALTSGAAAAIAATLGRVRARQNQTSGGVLDGARPERTRDDTTY